MALASAVVALFASHGQAQESVRKATVELDDRIPEGKLTDQLKEVLVGSRLLPIKVLQARRVAIMLENEGRSTSQVEAVQMAQRDLRHFMEVGRLWIFVLTGSVLALLSSAIQLVGWR